MPSLRIAILVAAGALASSSTLHAQCPDGTPPPCRAAAPARRVNPPLDERTWIVLPFDNVARASDIDWLRDASVNLLYLDMSKWRDVRVIDDERVADLMRDVPAAQRERIGLEIGLSVARRAGAGKLVMGDLLKVGNRTRVVAKIFEVRTGQRTRTVQEEAGTADSLMGAFTRLARSILSVPATEASALSAVGTTRLDAYREYVSGVAALNSWQLDSARARFDRALTLDSAFALAHYKLSIVYGWQSANAPERVAHAEAASRLGAALPPRERALVAGQLAQSRNRWADACDAYGSLVRADSSDVEAWYNFGECNYHNPDVIAIGGDTTHVMFRGSWNLALRAFRKALELDPTYHLAFAHIPDILQADLRTGCRASAPGQPCVEAYTAIAVRDGDSLVTAPVSQVTGSVELGRQREQAARTNSRRANYLQAADIARAWVEAGAGQPEPRARSAYGRALLRTGDIQGAAREFGAAAGAYWSRPERIQFAANQLEVLLKLDRHAEATVLVDSLLAATDTTLQVRFGDAIVAAAMGRLHAFDQRASTLSPLPAARAFFAASARVALGLTPESLAATEHELSAAIAAQSGGRVAPSAVLGPLYIWGLRLHPAGSVALDTADGSPLLRLAAFMLGDHPARASAALHQFDSTLLAAAIETPEDGSLLLSADAHLMLGDSAVALGRLVEFERRWIYQPLISGLWPQGLMMSSMLWGRTWLLMGDLAAAQHQPDVARRAYRRVVGMWSAGDAEVQPAVARARQALATLGN